MVGDALVGVRIGTTKSPSAEMLFTSNNPARFLACQMPECQVANDFSLSAQVFVLTMSLLAYQMP
jgi:hypothetical protein